jgi:hypothetical protein
MSFRCRALWIAVAWIASAPGFAAESARDVRILVVLRATEQPNHVFVTGMKNEAISVGRVFGEPSQGKSRSMMLYSRVTHLNDTFVGTIAGFDRDTRMGDALRTAFAERSAHFEITTTADAQKYLKRTALVTLSHAPRDERFDFVIAVHDDFVGLATLDWMDAEEGLMTPAYDISYSIYDAGNGEVVARGKASSSGYLRQPAQTAASDPALFVHLWPYLCTLNATAMVDELLRTDQLHSMMAKVGRGAEMPPVAAKLADSEQRLQWKLKPAGGWHERRTGKFSRVLEPRNESSSNVMRMSVTVDFLIPELGQQVASVAEYLPIFDRQRLRQAPRATPLERFSDIAAPGYDSYRYLGQAGEHNLVFLKTNGDSIVRVFTVSLSGKFEELYPRVRGKVESMLANSDVRLLSDGEVAKK